MRYVHPVYLNYELPYPINKSTLKVKYNCSTPTKWLIKWTLILTNPVKKDAYRHNVYIHSKSHSYDKVVKFNLPLLENKYVFGSLQYKMYNLTLLSNYKKVRGKIKVDIKRLSLDRK